MAVLVSFIGKGRKVEDPKGKVYEKLVYRFRSGKEIESAVFFDALLESGEFEINEAVIIGTKTSSWAVLLDNHLDTHDNIFDLYEEIETATENGIGTHALEKLGDALSELWGRRVRCHAHDSEITDKNAFAIISDYFIQLQAHSGVNQDIVMDITHSFRTMPVMLMIAMQMRQSISSSVLNHADIIYGELQNRDKGPSQVRYLTPAWDGVKVASAVRFFFEHFDGEDLGRLLEKDWKKGSDAVKRLGLTIQSMCLTRIDEVISQLRNALADQPVDLPEWIGPVVNRCTELVKKLDVKPKYKCIQAVADVLAENKNYGLALIALHLALEAFIYKEMKAEDRYGDYNAMYRSDGLWLKFSRNVKHGDQKRMSYIKNARNMVAHGGAKNREGGLPQPVNLPQLYQKCRSELESILSAKKPACSSKVLVK